MKLCYVTRTYYTPAQTHSLGLQALAKALHKNSLDVFGTGLEAYVPEKKLQPGGAFALEPEHILDRPLLTAAARLHGSVVRKMQHHQEQ